MAGFFARRQGGDGEQAESLARIESGGIPARAQERLRALATEGSLFTSGLSVNEFALLDRLGPKPLAQVMGASVVRTGWQYLPALDPGKVSFGSGSPYATAGKFLSAPTPTGYALTNVYTEPSIAQVRSYKWRAEVVCKLDVLTGAWNTARDRALDRLREEALQVGADAVVGVHLRGSDRDLGKGTIQYVVSGTAIRTANSPQTSAPTLTDLSVQDYWQLHNAGHEPVGLVASTVVVFASPPGFTRWRRARRTAQNQELPELSSAFQLARETVRATLRDQASEAHGTGAVGVEFAYSVHREKLALASSIQTSDRHGWHMGRFGMPYRVSGRGDVDRAGWVITMHAAGTAIRSRDSPPPVPVKTSMRMGPT
jgi:uncharacterized protein YbjQ (UPF0145 family)